MWLLRAAIPYCMPIYHRVVRRYGSRRHDVDHVIGEQGSAGDENTVYVYDFGVALLSGDIGMAARIQPQFKYEPIAYIDGAPIRWGRTLRHKHQVSIVIGRSGCAPGRSLFSAGRPARSYTAH